MHEKKTPPSIERWMHWLLHEPNPSTAVLFEQVFKAAMEISKLRVAMVARLRHETHLRIEALADRIGMGYKVGEDQPLDQIFVGEVAKKHDTIVVPDITLSPYARHPETLRNGLRSVVGAPLIFRGGQMYGVLALLDQQPQPLGKSELMQISLLGRWLSKEIELRLASRELTTKNTRLSALTQELHRLQTQVEQGSIRDSVTDLLNSRYFNQLLQTESARAQRHAYPLSLLLLVPDGYAAITKQYGTDYGYSALSSIGVLLRRHLRTIDNAARYSEDMFAILLPQTDLSGAAIVANRIRSTLGSHRFTAPNGQATPMTASLGIAGLNPLDDDPSMAMLSRSRRALEQARKAGGNRVIVASSMPTA